MRALTALVLLVAVPVFRFGERAAGQALAGYQTDTGTPV
jgi:hypothetical protein